MHWLRALLARLFGHTPMPPVVPILSVPRTTLGVCGHRWSGVELDGLIAIGCQHVRIDYYTQDTQEAHDSYERRLADSDAAGIEPLILVHDFPTLAEVPRVMATLTTRFPGRLFQVGNEYDAQPWRKEHPDWRGWTDSGASYAKLMNAVRAACPTARFVGMGLALDGVGQAKYLSEYLAAGGPMLEAWCIHSYGCPVSPTKALPTHAVLKGRMPLWVTEFGQNKWQIEAAWGAHTDASCEAEVAKQITAWIADAPKNGVTRAYVYCYFDGQDEGPNQGFGLVRPDESRRPSWNTIHTFLLP